MCLLKILEKIIFETNNLKTSYAYIGGMNIAKYNNLSKIINHVRFLFEPLQVKLNIAIYLIIITVLVDLLKHNLNGFKRN